MPLSPRIPDLASLDALATVARAGSMGAAASELGLSQQAVSARVKTAERLLGVAIFVRGPGGVAPTPAGRSILTWTDEVLRAAAALDDGAADLRGDPHASATVAVSNTVSEWLFPSWAAAVRRDSPTASVSAIAGNSDQVLAAVLEDRVDLGFVESPAVPGTLSSADVGTDELVVVVPPGHPWATRTAPLTAAELAATPLVVREHGSGTRTTFEHSLAALHLDPVAPLMEFGSTSAVREAVHAAGAPAVLSSLAVQRDLADRRLVRVPVVDLALPRTLRAVWNPHRRPRGVAADLLSAALSHGG